MAQKENSKKIWIVRIALAAVLVAALLISLIWTDAINRKFGLVKTVEGEYEGNSTQEVLAPGVETEGVGGDLNVHFVDVGQGDACIIEFPDDKKMLIDAGDTHKTNKDKLLKYIDENIKDAEGNTIEYFDYAVLTHPDSDHCGGMADVLSEYPAQVFYRPNVYSVYNDDKTDDDWKDPEKAAISASVNGNKDNEKNTRAYDRALKAAYDGRPDGKEPTVHVTDATNDEISLIEPDGLDKTDPDYYTFTFYAPIGSKSYKDNNNYSPVMILEYHNKRFMLSGDAEKDAEADFVAAASAGSGKYSVFDDNFTVDVFKLGHHGSRTSSSEAFINVMTTEENRPNVIAVVSCGEDNSYGHPHKEVIARLKEMGFADENIVRTDVNGNIAMSVRASTDADGNILYDNGKVIYELRMGAETVRRSSATVGNDTIALTWKEIVIVAIIVIVLVLIIMPIVQNVRREMRKATAPSGKGRRRK